MAKGESEVLAEEAKAPDRNKLRTTIFSGDHLEVKRKVITFNGVPLELRQPTVNDFLNMQDESTEDNPDKKKQFAISFLIQYAFIPGTEERLFETGDMEMLCSMPMNNSFMQVMQAANELMDIKTEEKVKN